MAGIYQMECNQEEGKMGEEGKFQLSKITNNHWLGLLAPTIKQFQEKINIQLLMKHFIHTLQTAFNSVGIYLSFVSSTKILSLTRLRTGWCAGCRI